jgi:hypothetical protein
MTANSARVAAGKPRTKYGKSDHPPDHVRRRRNAAMASVA